VFEQFPKSALALASANPDSRCNTLKVIHTRSQVDVASEGDAPQFQSAISADSGSTQVLFFDVYSQSRPS
jgi:hypothetical protein